MIPTYARHGNPHGAADLGYGPDDDYEPRACLYCGLSCDGDCPEARQDDPQYVAERDAADRAAWDAYVIRWGEQDAADRAAGGRGA